jgi:hypothetical protein
MSIQRNPQKELNPPFFDLDQLGARWHCHRLTAHRRLQRFGIKPLKLSGKSVLYRMSDIVQIESSLV